MSEPILPKLGRLPSCVPVVAKERVLHIALRDAREGQPGLARALKMISTAYEEIDWQKLQPQAFRILAVAAKFKPTLVFMQLQRASFIDAEVVVAMRKHCAPGAVIINWDGDQHREPESPERKWFVDLGKECDASLVVNTRHPDVYATMGVRNPGYLQIGIDEQIYRPVHVPGPAPRIVMLVSEYPASEAYAPRREIVRKLCERFPAEFAVYGNGWAGRPQARPLLKQDQEAAVYSSALASISMSIRNDLPRYTSDRLFRALASGGLVFVERFPEMEGLGLEHGRNCVFWSTWEELLRHLEDLPERYDDAQRNVRANAAGIGLALHSWPARMGELLAVVAEVRKRRVS